MPISAAVPRHAGHPSPARRSGSATVTPREKTRAPEGGGQAATGNAVRARRTPAGNVIERMLRRVFGQTQHASQPAAQPSDKSAVKRETDLAAATREVSMRLDAGARRHGITPGKYAERRGSRRENQLDAHAYIQQKINRLLERANKHGMSVEAYLARRDQKRLGRLGEHQRHFVTGWSALLDALDRHVRGAGPSPDAGELLDQLKNRSAPFFKGRHFQPDWDGALLAGREFDEADMKRFGDLRETMAQHLREYVRLGKWNGAEGAFFTSCINELATILGPREAVEEVEAAAQAHAGRKENLRDELLAKAAQDFIGLMGIRLDADGR